MASGLFALLDDITAMTKVAASSLDDVAAQTIKAGGKAASILIDDAAVTPRYVVGFAAHREFSIIGRIAVGSLRNKLLSLLPAALALSAFAPWPINPILMLGGIYLASGVLRSSAISSIWSPRGPRSTFKNSSQARRSRRRRSLAQYEPT